MPTIYIELYSLFHTDRSIVMSFTSFHATSMPFDPGFYPTFPGSAGSRCSACLADRFSSIRYQCPNHHNRYCPRVFSSRVIPFLRRASSFVILPFQLIPSSFPLPPVIISPYKCNRHGPGFNRLYGKRINSISD